MIKRTNRRGHLRRCFSLLSPPPSYPHSCSPSAIRKRKKYDRRAEIPTVSSIIPGKLITIRYSKSRDRGEEEDGGAGGRAVFRSYFHGKKAGGGLTLLPGPFRLPRETTPGVKVGEVRGRESRTRICARLSAIVSPHDARRSGGYQPAAEDAPF